ncbi:unnamed protein product [Paramecium pentaurelia]|uniref:Uncharacterized protein n=1 Tax=Paramecium pentaurelia TaxID=43138 RepID=A0A8S1XNI5_9CILI|nr:unnamed protein product [Paramecium pentaurelia]
MVKNLIVEQKYCQWESQELFYYKKTNNLIHKETLCFAHLQYCLQV